MKNFIKCYIILVLILLSFSHQIQAMQPDDNEEGQRSSHVISQAVKPKGHLPLWFSTCSGWANTIANSLSYYYKWIYPGSAPLKIDLADPLLENSQDDRNSLGNSPIVSSANSTVKEFIHTGVKCSKKSQSSPRVNRIENLLKIQNNERKMRLRELGMFREPTLESLKSAVHKISSTTFTVEDEIRPQTAIHTLETSLPEPSIKRSSIKRNAKASIKKLRKIQQTKLLISILTKNKNVESIKMINKTHRHARCVFICINL